MWNPQVGEYAVVMSDFKDSKNSIQGEVVKLIFVGEPERTYHVKRYGSSAVVLHQISFQRLKGTFSDVTDRPWHFSRLEFRKARACEVNGALPLDAPRYKDMRFQKKPKPAFFTVCGDPSPEVMVALNEVAMIAAKQVDTASFTEYQRKLAEKHQQSTSIPDDI